MRALNEFGDSYTNAGISTRFTSKPGRPHIGGRRANRLFARFGFPVEGDESDSVARHNRAIVAAGLIERFTFFGAESRRSQHHGKAANQQQ